MSGAAAGRPSRDRRLRGSFRPGGWGAVRHGQLELGTHCLGENGRIAQPWVGGAGLVGSGFPKPSTEAVSKRLVLVSAGEVCPS